MVLQETRHKEIKSDNKNEKDKNFRHITQRNYSQLKPQYITKEVLEEAIKILRKKKVDFENRMKESPHQASDFSRQQKQCDRAIQWLENFSPEQVDAVRNAAERRDNDENTRLSCHIGDALSTAIEKKKDESKLLEPIRITRRI